MQDHLNTHKPASRYEAFPPEEARRLIDKREIHDSPSTAVGSRLLNEPAVE